MKTLGAVFGIAFILTGILGFIPNPVIGPEYAIFHTDTAHNIIHLVIGAILLSASAKGASAARKATVAMATLYLLLAVIGFFQLGPSGGEGELLGFAHANSADNWLHVGLAAVLYLGSMVKTTEERVKENWV